jgi:hypothetical protein
MEKSLTEEFLEMGEEWQGAIEALIASGTPNPKPLAALIRGSASIPSGVREMLAELLDPQEPEFVFSPQPQVNKNARAASAPFGNGMESCYVVQKAKKRRQIL